MFDNDIITTINSEKLNSPSSISTFQTLFRSYNSFIRDTKVQKNNLHDNNYISFKLYFYQNNRQLRWYGNMMMMSMDYVGMGAERYK